MVGVDAEARLAARDPQRLEGPEPAGRAGRLGVRRELVARAPGRSPWARQATRELVGHVGDLDPRHEDHPLEELQQRPAGTGLGVDGERLAVVDAGEGVLDVALRAQHQRVGPAPRRQVGEVLGGQRVEPGQPVGAGDPQHVAVGEVDEAVARLERALLAVEGAVVAGDGGVDPLGGDRAGEVEQGAGHRQSRAGPEDGQVADVDGEAVVGLERSSRGVSTSGSTEIVARQFRQTRWKCSWSLTEWYVGARSLRWAWRTSPSSSSTSRVR